MIGTNFPRHRFFKNATDLILPQYTSTRTLELEKDDDKKKKKQRQQEQHYKARIPVFKYQNSLKTLRPNKSTLNLPKIDEEHSPKYKDQVPTFTEHTPSSSLQPIILQSTTESTENAKKLIAANFRKKLSQEILTKSTLAAIQAKPVERHTPQKILNSSKFQKSIKYNSGLAGIQVRNLHTDSIKKSVNEQTREINNSALPVNSKLYTIGCGFSKDDDPRIKINSEHCIDEKVGSRNFGEDAAFVTHTENADIMGVSDGVGGWRNQGVDPSIFSGTLMKNCLDIAKSSNFDVKEPIQLMDDAYKKLLTVPNLIGSATACTAAFDRKTKLLYTANLGDSGWLVIRNGEIVAKSKPLTHYFNAPYQLAKVPNPRPGGITNYPKQADFQKVKCEIGDVIILATDGLFDNVYDSHVTAILKQLSLDEPKQLFGNPEANSLPDSENSDSESGGSNDSNRAEAVGLILEHTSQQMVEYTRMRAHQQNYFSPFCQEYMQASNGKRITGGKVDDITILVSVVGPKNCK